MTAISKTIDTASLQIAYEQTGADGGIPIVLLHGFPYDVRQYDDAIDALADPSYRIIVPYLRGFGPTRYRDAGIVRSGQQAAIGKDVVDLLDALGISRAIVAGYDWGGRAACVAAALWPDRIAGVFSQSAYTIQDIAKTHATPEPVDTIVRHWYQSYFNTPQGEIGLREQRDDFCRTLWRLWSPTWAFDDAAFRRTAASFANPDFVATVIHSYRHRFGNAPGDPALDDFEAQLAKQPSIAAPTMVLHGTRDDVDPKKSIAGHERHFTGFYEAHELDGIGHCVPAEAPEAFAEAIASLVMRADIALHA